jgi:chromosomal replication initiator protein
MTIRLTENKQAKLIDILELYSGYFGEDVTELVEIVKGENYTKHLEKDIKDIIEKVYESTGIPFAELKSNSRKRPVTLARQYAMYQIYDQLYTKAYTLEEIGKVFNRDHSTVLHSIKMIRQLIETNEYQTMKIHNSFKAKCE